MRDGVGDSQIDEMVRVEVAGIKRVSGRSISPHSGELKWEPGLVKTRTFLFISHLWPEVAS